MYDALLTVGEPPVSWKVIVLLPQVSSSPEPAVGLSDSFMLQAEELVPKVSAETPPAEVIEEKEDVMLPASLSESSESVSVSVSTLESDSV